LQENVVKRTRKQRLRERIFLISKYFLLTAILSFIGWLYEVLLIRVRYGYWTDRGFMRMPLCPIYGCTLLFTYFFIGLPKGTTLKDEKERGVLWTLKNPILHTAMYLLFAFLIPTAAEFFIGFLFDKAFHVTLWSYASMPLNFHGYISAPVSLVWSALIYLFMRCFFLPLKRWIFSIPNTAALSVATLLFFISAVDVAMRLIKI
jgi:uncharacterized membrane protein